MQQEINQDIIFEQIDDILARAISENDAVIASFGTKEQETPLIPLEKQEVVIVE